jgi:predicted  nucleic acid-binding Zn-ribbon protein
MPDLGKKYECFNCGTKFYNLGKPEAICPKCGANQKNARTDDAPPPAPRPPRRPAILEPIPDEPANEFGEEGPAPEESDSDDDDEFAEDDEAEEKERDEEEEF